MTRISPGRSGFLALALAQQALRFGSFTLKSGRQSPYFFNAGAFNSGAALAGLANAYADTLLVSGIRFDLLFGPAYKGIPLAAATACALAARGYDCPFAFNRKEPKDHGEGGLIVGAGLHGDVVIIDDVISAGTSVRESVALIKDHGARPAAVLIALDRQERGQENGQENGQEKGQENGQKKGQENGHGSGALSAAQEVEQRFGIPVLAIARLDDLLAFVAAQPELVEYRSAMRHYRQRYGIA